MADKVIPFTVPEQLMTNDEIKKLAIATRKLLFMRGVRHIEEIKQITDTVRCAYPKAYFKAVKDAIKASSTAIIATEFKQQGDSRPPTLAAYTKELYWKTDRPRPLPWWPLRGPRVRIDDDDMLEALKRLSSGKAVGIDGLPDRQLKRVLNTNVTIREKCRA